MIKPSVCSASYMFFVRLYHLLTAFTVMLTIASIVSLAVGIWEDYSPRHPADEPRVGW
jgi:hypothetical protein